MQKVKKMKMEEFNRRSGSEEKLELSDELSRHLLSVGSKSGLSLIKKIPNINVRARGNSLFLSGNETGIEFVRDFVKTLQKRIQVTEALDPFEIMRIFEQITSNEFGNADSQKQTDKKLSFEEIARDIGTSIEKVLYVKNLTEKSAHMREIFVPKV